MARRQSLRLKGVSISRSARVSWRAKIDPMGGKISIGAGTIIHPYVLLLAHGGVISIAKESTVNPFSILYGHGSLYIGSYVRIAAGTIIIPANHCFTDKSVPIFKQGLSQHGIVIHDDVWVGAGARILDGVSVGSGSVIAAGTVVSRTVPKNVVVAGVPAKVIRYL